MPVANGVTGPYRIVNSDILPLGMGAGNFDVFGRPDGGKAYMAFERVHTGMIVADLTDEYTGFTGYFTTHLPQSGAPFTREGLSYFRRRARHYIISSGTTGYFPNPTRVAVADTFHGPWNDLGLLAVGDNSETTFNSQINCVFQHPKKRDLFTAVADHWMGPMGGADFDDGEPSRKVRKAIEARFITGRMDAEDERLMAKYGDIELDTSVARTDWLPLRFDGDRPKLIWRYSWSLDEFA